MPLEHSALNITGVRHFFKPNRLKNKRFENTQVFLRAPDDSRLYVFFITISSPDMLASGKRKKEEMLNYFFRTNIYTLRPAMTTARITTIA